MRKIVLLLAAPAAVALAVALVIPSAAEEPLPEFVPEAAPEAAPESAPEPVPEAEPESVPEPVPDGEDEAERGVSLIEEGARLLLRGLMAEMEPAMKDMAEGLGAFAREAEPMLRELSRLMGSIGDYQAPELLPNGDIIIRKRPPGPPRGPEFGPLGETDL